MRGSDPDEPEAQEMRPIDQSGDAPMANPPAPAAIAMGEPSRFPLVGLGYDRAVVDEHLVAIERELERLRAESRPPVSVAEELERLGEQTASILVVAHDQAQETARAARDEAERRLADAHAEAASITARASARLRELDDDTDSIWRERERLLDDVRMVSVALGKLANDASERFPAAPPQHTAPFDVLAAPPDAFDELDRLGEEGDGTDEAAAGEPPTETGNESARAESGADTGPAAGSPGTPMSDTGSWLVGLRPDTQ